MGNLSTPKSVQKLRKALHAKAKAEAGYRFYALYDKIVREDILAHAYARDKPGHDDVDRFKHLFAGESERTTPPIAGAPGNCLGSDID